MRLALFPKSFLFLLVGALASGCEERPLTAPGGVPTFSRARGPAESGVVVRFQFENVFPNFNFDDALLAITSSESGLGFGCTETTASHPFEGTNIFSPSGRIQFHYRNDEAFVTVYDWTGFPDLDCAFLADESRILARGTAVVKANDNDTAVDGPGINASTIEVRGVLIDVNGQPVKYHLKRTLQFTEDGGFVIRAAVGPSLSPDPR